MDTLLFYGQQETTMKSSFSFSSMLAQISTIELLVEKQLCALPLATKKKQANTVN